MRGIFVVESVEEVGGRYAVEMVNKSGMGNLRILMEEEPEEGDEFDFVLKERREDKEGRGEGSGDGRGSGGSRQLGLD